MLLECIRTFWCGYMNVSDQQNKKMIELNEIETKYLKLMDKEISIKDFENWVYSSNWLEDELSEDEYTDLISLNYENSGSRYEVGKILENRLDLAKFEAFKFIEMLNSIIERNGKEGEALTIMYDLYCKGYYFLEGLGLGIGLFVHVPNKYDVEYYHELNEKQKKELLDSVYPSAKELAIEIKTWLLAGDLKLTGEKEPELNRWQYIDNRTDDDKKSRVWEIADVDKKTGEVRSKRNVLLNSKGEFKKHTKEKDNWLKRVFKRKKPNR